MQTPASCVVPANDLLSGRVDLTSYPARYVIVGAPRPNLQVGSGPVDLGQALAAVELLESHGWALVNTVNWGGGRESPMMTGFLLRRENRA